YGPLHVVLTLATHQKRNDLYYHPLSVMSYPVFHVTEFVPPSTTVHVLESRKYPVYILLGKPLKTELFADQLSLGETFPHLLDPKKIDTVKSFLPRLMIHTFGFRLPITLSCPATT